MKTQYQSISLWAEIGHRKPVPGRLCWRQRGIFWHPFWGVETLRSIFWNNIVCDSYCSINCTKVIAVLSSLSFFFFHFAILVSKYSFAAIAMAYSTFCVPLKWNSSAMVSLGPCLGAAESNHSVPNATDMWCPSLQHQRTQQRQEPFINATVTQPS